MIFALVGLYIVAAAIAFAIGAVAATKTQADAVRRALDGLGKLDAYAATAMRRLLVAHDAAVALLPHEVEIVVAHDEHHR